MVNKSKIEWTDTTWNPVRGCTKISPGCKHCYASTFAERFRGVAGHPYEQGFDLRLVPKKLLELLLWNAPSMVFVNSMSDLFHSKIPVPLFPPGTPAGDFCPLGWLGPLVPVKSQQGCRAWSFGANYR